jgi:hypothetical protein
VQLLSAEVARPEAQYLRGGRVDEDDASVGVRADDALAARRIISVCRCERASSASVSTVPERSRTTSISSSSPV